MASTTAYSLPPEEEGASVPLAAGGAGGALPPAAASGYAYSVSWGFSLPPLPPGMAVPALLHPDRGRETLQGLGRLRLATSVALCANLLTATVGVMALYIVVTPGVAPGILSLPPALVLMLTSFLVQAIAVAFGWSAFEDIADASHGMGADHADAARRAVLLAYVAVATWVVGGLVSLALVGAYFSSGIGSLPLGQLPHQAVLAITVAFAVTGVGVNAVVGLGMQTLIGRLLTAKGRAMRRRFWQLAMGGTVASAGLSMFCTLVLGIVDLYGLVAVVSAASLAVFLGQIREAERGTAAMAAARGHDPDAELPAGTPPGGAEG
jgi:hypothetical protein